MKKLKKNNKVNILYKLKNKDKLVPYNKKELAFNIISIILIIGIGLYYGGRSFYYYSKQNMRLAEAVHTLNGSVTLVKPVTDGEGLHQDVDGYYFKGNVSNNYVKFGNRIFRIIRVNNDGTTKVVSDDIVSEFMYGDESSYLTSNIRTWLTKDEKIEQSGIYYDTIPYPNDFLVKTHYSIDTFDEGKVSKGKDSYKDYITTLSIKDYSLANGKNSYLNINKYFWINGIDKSQNNYYVSEDGSLLTGSLYQSYGVRSVFTFKKDLQISGGDGTKDNPYVIKQDNSVNLVDSYVNISGDIWKVFAHKDGIVKLAYTNFTSTDFYSKKTSLFDPTNRYNIAFKLNKNLLNSLAYKDKLLDFNVYTGEVSNDTSLSFTNIYSSFVTTKVGMLNLFDYHNLGLDNYYLSNTTSSVGKMVYVYHNYGMLEETTIDDARGIIPVISLNAETIDIKEGNGTVDSPYIVR